MAEKMSLTVEKVPKETYRQAVVQEPVKLTPKGQIGDGLANIHTRRCTHMPPSTSIDWTRLQPPASWRLTVPSVRITLLPRRPHRSNSVMDGSENSWQKKERGRGGEMTSKNVGRWKLKMILFGGWGINNKWVTNKPDNVLGVYISIF